MFLQPNYAPSIKLMQIKTCRKSYTTSLTVNIVKSDKYLKEFVNAITKMERGQYKAAIKNSIALRMVSSIMMLNFMKAYVCSKLNANVQ